MHIESPFLIKNQTFEDERGSLTPVGIGDYWQDGMRIDDCRWIQLNHVVSRSNVFRGMHFQRGEWAQSKLITVHEGMITDVVFNLKTEAIHTFEMFPGESLFVPYHCAHGFLSKTPSIVSYLVNREYKPHSEAGFRFDDPALNIAALLPQTKTSYTLSGKDFALPTWKELRVTL